MEFKHIPGFARGARSPMPWAATAAVTYLFVVPTFIWALRPEELIVIQNAWAIATFFLVLPCMAIAAGYFFAHWRHNQVNADNFDFYSPYAYFGCAAGPLVLVVLTAMFPMVFSMSLFLPVYTALLAVTAQHALDQFMLEKVE